ncbi:globin-like protein [Lindgomyces ingoldianus]|uniref:Globin-like protein n=1 Tax=Lindgomyces ingoldianus TaxID=673940 RepID=A0ACB6QZ43_9PLEO|nr:globin-like protein [Lindgomyces ingoldianus]KAF2471833.1 globin-like protein [Lindgomyces ingoldianus]
MAPTLSPEQVATIKATVPVLAAYGETITRQFYKNMLAANPSLKSIFNHTHQATGHQPRALAGSLFAYASNIDDLGKLSPAVELICHKHASLYVQPDQYKIVGKHLLETMKEVLGDAATPEIMEAWGVAYWQLAEIMIGKEAGMYEETHGWTDWKDFKIVRKENESIEITSFYLEPVDASLKLPLFKPGQYISVQMFVDELEGGVWQARQYSLSDAPGKNYLRISVKREEGVEIGDSKSMTHPGYLSNILHDVKQVGDVVRVSHPFGDFFFDEKERDKDAPVALISAGVGLTCLTSILNKLAAENSTRPISWIHVARNSGTRAFKSHIDGLVASNKRIQTILFDSEPSVDEVQGQDYNIEGRLDLDKISSDVLFTKNDKAQYFVCGPTQFMLDVEAKLKSFGVVGERVKMELFGTGGVPRI